MNELEKDIYYTERLLEGKDSKNYDCVYFSTNEHLDDIFSNFDFKDKKVLSVIGSGDQAFHFYNSGVKKLDLFDINKLSFYYYYLRVWTMEYLKRSYPIKNMDSSYISNLLDLVNPKTRDEKIAYFFWKSFIKNFNNDFSKYLFIPSFLELDEDKYDDTKLFDTIGNYNPKFYHIDLTKNVNVGSKYDYIYTSNIHEYIESDEQFVIYRNNLNRLLKKNGIVICTNVMENGPKEEDNKIMNRKFKCNYLPIIDYDYGVGVDSLGYYYKKRRFHL